MQMLRWRLNTFCVYRSLIILGVISLTALCKILVVDVLQVLINRVIMGHIVTLHVHISILDILNALSGRVGNDRARHA